MFLSSSIAIIQTSPYPLSSLYPSNTVKGSGEYIYINSANDYILNSVCIKDANTQLLHGRIGLFNYSGQQIQIVNITNSSNNICAFFNTQNTTLKGNTKYIIIADNFENIFKDYYNGGGDGVTVSYPVYSNETYSPIKWEMSISDCVGMITANGDNGCQNYTEYFWIIRSLNLTESVNNLPYFENISFSNLCINENDTNANIKLNFSATDSENDTIYYSFSNYNVKTSTERVLFTNKFIGLTYVPNYDFLNNVVNPDNANCNISTDTQPYNMNENYLQYQFTTLPPQYYLYLQPACIGDKKFDYRLKYPYENLVFSTDLGSLNNGDSFNLTFYTEGFSNITMRFKFQMLNNYLEIYDYYNTLILNRSPSKYPLFQVNAEKINSNTGDIITIQDKDNKYYYDLFERANNLSTSFVEVSYNTNTDLLLGSFYYYGVADLPNYTTTNYYNLSVFNTGLYELSLRITDNSHMVFNQYNEKKYSFNINYCDETINVNNNFGNVDITGLGSALKAVNLQTCGMVNSVSSSLNGGVSYNSCGVFRWFIYGVSFIVAVVIVAIVAFIFPSITPSAFLIAFSLCIWVGNLLIYDLTVGEKVLASVLMLLGIVMLIINIFTANTGTTQTGN